MLSQRAAAGSHLLCARFGGSGLAMQTAELEARKRRKQLGELVQHKQHVQQLLRKLQTKIDHLDRLDRGVAAPGE